MEQLRRLRSMIRIGNVRTGPSRAKFQVLSDLHLEVGQQYLTWDFPANAPYLILAGDIGQLVDYEQFLTFIERQIACFESVFLVLGNHEFYGLSHSEGLEEARKLENEPRLQGKLNVLYRNRVDVPDANVTILGCTLWSKINDDTRELIQSKVSDFHRISNWTTNSHDAEHTKDIDWLREQVTIVQQDNVNATSQPGRSMLIITHHAPCTKGTSEPRFEGNDVNSAFSTDLLEQDGQWRDVAAWVYGHTHYSTKFQKSGVTVVSNQRGYVFPGVKMRNKQGHRNSRRKKFDEGFVLSI